MNNSDKDKKRKSLGKLGEDLAVSFLKQEGYKILAQNFHSRYGEIDIIAFDSKTEELVLVEVKTRKSSNFGVPEESVTSYKLDKIMKTGYFFQNKFPSYADLTMRVDVLAIKVESGGIKRFEHLRNVWLD